MGRPPASPRRRASTSRWRREEQLLLRALRGEPARWPTSEGPRFHKRFLEAARRHGVLGLVQDRLRNRPEWVDWPREIREALPLGPGQMALDLLKERELRHVLTRLAESGSQPLLMKGAALAYTHYPSPHLRARFDTDILIPESASGSTWSVLKQCGYERSNTVPGELIFYECVCSRTDELGLEHVLDVHWKLSSNQLFAESFSYEELARRAVAVSALGEEARSLDPVHALLVALMHRVAHAPYREGNRLIWLYDIHLLAAAMLPAQWERFTVLASAKALCRIALDGLLLTRDTLGTRIPAAVLSELAAPGTSSEPAAAYLASRPWQTFLADLRALPNWRRRLQLIREHLLPPAFYMRKKYRCRSRFLLPFLYVYRIITGIWKYL